MRDFKQFRRAESSLNKTQKTEKEINDFIRNKIKYKNNFYFKT